MDEPLDTGKSIAVIGMGPVGQILAVHLKEAGVRVILCDTNKSRMHLIRRSGIQLVGEMQKQASFEEVCTSVRELLPLDPDIIVFSVKAYHLERVLSEMQDFPRERTAYISAQNGIDVELALADAFKEANTFRMVVNYAGNHKAPNVIGVNFFNPPNYIASIDDSRPEIATFWADLLNSVHLDTIAVDSFEILRRVWEKTVLNSSLSALCAVAQMTMKEVMELPDMVHIVEQIIVEAIAVAKAENIQLEPNFLRHCLRYLRRSGNHFPSLAVDVLQKSPTEIDYLNGKFVEYGKKHYIPTPMHLAFTNMVKAITKKHTANGNGVPAPTRANIPWHISGNGAPHADSYYLGIDLGSAYTKIAVISDQHDIMFKQVVRTHSRDRQPLYEALKSAQSHFPIEATCAAGYGREHFPDADVTKTEIHCAAQGAYRLLRTGCNVIDIGAEDIKVIQVDHDGRIAHFYMNSKCAAGTGAFLTEMAEKIEIGIDDMSKLAALSSTERELNSFCTVFAKTEVMKWTFEQVPTEDIARGIYLSLVNRIKKLALDPDLPVVLAGGVVAHHPYLRNLLEERLGRTVSVVPEPQFCVAFGAALYAHRHSSAISSHEQSPALTAAL